MHNPIPDPVPHHQIADIRDTARLPNELCRFQRIRLGKVLFPWTDRDEDWKLDDLLDGSRGLFAEARGAGVTSKPFAMVPIRLVWCMEFELLGRLMVR
jgi:hypothetical protein